MPGWFAMTLAPLLFGASYLIHSLRVRRFRQAAAVAVLLLFALAALAVLLWEYLAVP